MPAYHFLPPKTSKEFNLIKAVFNRLQDYTFIKGFLIIKYLVTLQGPKNPIIYLPIGTIVNTLRITGIQIILLEREAINSASIPLLASMAVFIIYKYPRCIKKVVFNQVWYSGLLFLIFYIVRVLWRSTPLLLILWRLLPIKINCLMPRKLILGLIL